MTANFAICVNNEGFAASLELRKVYPIVPDPDGAHSGLIRVIDESGEDYLYDAANFVPFELPGPAARAIRSVS